VLTAIGLFALDVPMALMLGVISGLCQFVPYLGAFAGSVPAILIGLVQSPLKGFEVAVLYLVVHMVEGYFVTPMIQQRTIALPAAALVSVQLIMGAVFGITGIIFATPAAVVVIVLVQTVYLRGILGDHVSVLGQ
jgi:predicted PurR-regulated permease PerM